MKKITKLLIPVAVTLMTATSAMAEVPTISPVPDLQIPSPITEHKNIGELKEAVDFIVSVPKMPDKYKIDNISDISGQIAQITYTDGKNSICYRKSKGTEDISGDYNLYNKTQVITIHNINVELKGNGDLIKLAVWHNKTHSYSLGIEGEGMSLGEVTKILDSIDF